MYKIRITSIVLCLTMVFVMFSNAAYAETGVTYIDETTIVIKDGEVISGDASLVDKGIIVIGDEATADKTVSSGKQPIKDNSVLVTPDGSTGVVSDGTLPTETPTAYKAPTGYIAPKTGFTDKLARALRSSNSYTVGNNWVGTDLQLMVTHVTRYMNSSGNTYTMNIPIIARGFAIGDAAFTEGTNSSVNFKEAFYHVNNGTLNITNTGSNNSGNTTLEGLRLCYQSYVKVAATSTDEAYWYIGGNNADTASRWSNSTSGDFPSNQVSWNTAMANYPFEPLVIVDGGTANIYDDDGRVYIQNNLSTSSGGAIQVNGGSLKLTNTTIRNCKADGNGGGIYLGAGTATLKNVTIDSCAAETNGGAICVGNGATLKMDTVTISNCTAAYGGAIYAYANSTITFTKVTIKNNHATGNGGGMWLGAVKDITLGSGNVISGNSVVGTGGGIALARGAKITVDGAEIHTNTANHGGGIACYSESNGGDPILIINKGKIYGNKANNSGGGIWINAGQGHQFNNTTNEDNASAISENEAPNGAGIYVQSNTYTGGPTAGKITITEGKLYGNVASQNGGAIYVASGAALAFNGNDTQGLIGADNAVSGNTAVLGAGVYVASGGTFTMTGGMIKNNAASDMGGGVYATGACTININGSGASAVCNNTADSQGGGFYITEITSANRINIKNISVNDNIAKADRGGGMYINFTAANKANKANIENVTFSDNVSDNDGGTINGHGGGIYVVNCTLSITGCKFNSNTATYRGGGLYCTSNTVTEVKNSSFTGNTAGSFGGGFHLYDGAQATVINSSFDGNSAQHGGAILCFGVSANSTVSTLNLVDTSIGTTTKNTASLYGGGISAQEFSLVRIVGGNISNNEATYGGGIYAPNASSTVVISDSTDILPTAISATGGSTVISNNKATAGNGGGMCISLARVEIKGAQINGNTASGFGGGVQLYKAKGVDGDTVTFSNIKANGNTSTGNAGGGISVDTSVLNLSGNNEINNNTAYYYGGGMVVRVDGGGTGISTVNVNLDDTGSTAINGNTVTTTYGGGVHVSSLGVSTFNMKGGTINNNTCNNRSGGGIDCEDNVSLNGTTVSGNTAKNGGNAAFGGGINVRTATGNLDLVNCTVSNNNAQNGGGIAITDGAYGEISGGTISGNTAEESGGILIFNGSSSDIDNVTISGNTASNGDGGGVLVVITSTLTMIDCYVINNSANGTYTADKTTNVSEHTLVGTGGGLGVYDNSTLTFTVNNKNGAIYGNTATTAGDDVFANGIGTQVYIPAPDEMNTTGYGKENAVWWEDYMSADENYGQGLNGEPEIVERYDKTPISIRAYTSSGEGTSPSGEYINDAGQFVAISFDVQKYNVGSVKITAPDGTDNNQRFVFTVIGKPIVGDDISFTISIPAGESVTITKLVPGKYTVTMEGGWSWRYTLNGVTLDGANAGAGAVEVTVTGLELNELYELAYFADRSSPYWLNYHSDVVNYWTVREKTENRNLINLEDYKTAKRTVIDNLTDTAVDICYYTAKRSTQNSIYVQRFPCENFRFRKSICGRRV